MKILSEKAKQILSEIEEEGCLANREYFENCEGWKELVENDMVNCWDDDAGNEYVEAGRQC